MGTTTVYLAQTRGRIKVARGPHAVTLEPGGYADVPDELLPAVSAAGASKRSRPSGGDDTDSADGGAEEE